MNKVALLTDIHFGVRGESDVLLNAHKEFLDYFFKYITDNDITDVWFLGDMFDNRKTISSKLLKWFNDNWVKPIHEHNIHVTMIIGNHDTYYKNTNTPNTVEELLGNDENHTLIIDNAYKTQNKAHTATFTFIPWVCSSNEEKLLESIRIASNENSIILGHFDIQGMLYQSNQVSTHGFEPELFNGAKMVISGHYHKKSSKDNIHYLGNPVPTTWGEAPDEHGFHIFDLDTLDLDFIVYDANLYQRIVINTTDKITESYNGAKFVRIVVKQKNEYYYQNFLTSLREYDSIVHLSIVDDTNDLQNDVDVDMDIVSSDLLTLLNEYVDTSNIDNKDKIKTIFSEVYREIQ